MPIQCPRCFGIMCLQAADYKPSRDADAEKVHFGRQVKEIPTATTAGDRSREVKHGALVVRCLRKDCKYKKLIEQREGSYVVKSGEGGNWMTVKLDDN